jgi:transposase
MDNCFEKMRIERVFISHSKRKRDQFIEMRAQGLSFDKISVALNVSKPTLIKWQAEYGYEISTAEFLQTEARLEMHKVNRLARMEQVAARLEKVGEAIKAKEYGKEKLTSLFEMEKNLLEDLAAMTAESRAFTGHYRTDGEPYYPGARLQPVLKINQIL